MKLTFRAVHRTGDETSEHLIDGVVVTREVHRMSLLRGLTFRYLGADVHLFLHLAQQVQQELMCVMLLHAIEHAARQALQSDRIKHRYVALLFVQDLGVV